MMRNNYRYSVDAARALPGQRHSVPVRVERGGVWRRQRCSARSAQHEAPLNVYGYSKFLFDQYVRRLLPDRTAQIVGFRYFNVYGPREQHKGRMASVALALLRPVPRATARVRLFEGSGGYAAGEQRRDFVARRRRRRGEPRLPRSSRALRHLQPRHGPRAEFNAVAAAVDQRDAQGATGEPAATLAELVRGGRDRVHRRSRRALAGKYQSFTRGRPDARCARAATPRRFAPVEQGVARYVEWLIAHARALRNVRHRRRCDCASQRGDGVRDITSKEDRHEANPDCARCRAVARFRRRRCGASTSTRRRRTSWSRCPASARPRRRRSSTIAKPTARSSRSTSLKERQGHRREAFLQIKPS